jgi:CheY-like chemotaxis protein
MKTLLAPSTPAMQLRLNILLAEDDENDVLLLKLAFKQAGIQNPVHVAGDGQEAIDLLSKAAMLPNRASHPMPGLLILDLKMPRKSGLDVLRWLRQQPLLHCLPVIILSTSAHRHDLERAYQLGANAFIVKPAANEERTQLAGFIKGFWLQFNQPPIVCTDGLEAARKIHAELKDYDEI